MKETIRTELWLGFFFVVGALVFTAGYVEAGGDKNRSRTFYAPVLLVVPPELSDVKLWVEGDETIFPPGRRTFLFTYYLDERKVVPTHIVLRIQAQTPCGDGELDANVVLSLDGIFSGTNKVEYDIEQIKRQLRTRRDVRLPLRVIHIGCGNDQDGPNLVGDIVADN